MTSRTEQYIGFARKYRPQNFAALKGQDALVKVLSSSIIGGRLATGYLLTGIRGVGKTTSARIIARTINCTDVVVDNDGVSPCGQCKNCQSFAEQKHPDIIEIDAASRTSVDDVRRIIESSEYMPLLGKYKVFIVDEVHMLSKGAFNALLKILEEPPPHVIFIFATTEVQKIPLTVISRCQRYDLRRLHHDEIVMLLNNIAASEDLRCESNALHLIAAKSDGSAREAVSLLDQLASVAIAQGGGEITTSLVEQMLGVTDVRTIVALIKCIMQKDAEGAMRIVKEVYISALNLEEFLKSFNDFLAYLVKSKTLGSYQEALYTQLEDEVITLLPAFQLSELSILWQICSKGIVELKTTHNPLISLEMTVIKMIYAKTLPTPEDLVKTTTGNPRSSEQIPRQP